MTDLASAVAGLSPDGGLRTGKVTRINPLEVNVAGGTVEGAGRLGPVAVGDTVSLMRTGDTWLVLGVVIPATAPNTSVPNYDPGEKVPWLLINGWTALAGYDVPHYRKDSNGWVHMGGVMLSGTIGSNIQAGLATASIYRPGTTQIFGTVGGSTNGSVRVDVPVSGGLYITGGSATQYVSLAGLYWRAGSS